MVHSTANRIFGALTILLVAALVAAAAVSVFSDKKSLRKKASPQPMETVVVSPPPGQKKVSTPPPPPKESRQTPQPEPPQPKPYETRLDTAPMPAPAASMLSLAGKDLDQAFFVSTASPRVEPLSPATTPLEQASPPAKPIPAPALEQPGQAVEPPQDLAQPKTTSNDINDIKEIPAPEKTQTTGVPPAQVREKALEQSTAQAGARPEKVPAPQETPQDQEPAYALLFGFDKDALTSQEDEKLQAFLAGMGDTAARVYLQGHTCSMGPAWYNENLSQRRAEHAAARILELAPSLEGKIEISWAGETSPAHDNATPEGRRLNRRVEIRLERIQAETQTTGEQGETMMRPEKRVSVIGAGSCDEATYAAARELGAGLAEAGFTVVCGGLGGVMRAVCQGASERGGRTIGILPGADRDAANEFVSVPVATSLSHMRNYLVVLNGDVVVAVEGETGTLSELALAQKSGKKVIALGRWKTMDGVVPAQDPEEALRLVREFLGTAGAT